VKAATPIGIGGDREGVTEHDGRPRASRRPRLQQVGGRRAIDAGQRAQDLGLGEGRIDPGGLRIDGQRRGEPIE
jgi:hypothetical protein